MFVECVNQDCPEYQLPKSADEVDPTLVECGHCHQPCQVVE